MDLNGKINFCPTRAGQSPLHTMQRPRFLRNEKPPGPLSGSPTLAFVQMASLQFGRPIPGSNQGRDNIGRNDTGSKKFHPRLDSADREKGQMLAEIGKFGKFWDRNGKIPSRISRATTRRPIAGPPLGHYPAGIAALPQNLASQMRSPCSSPISRWRRNGQRGKLPIFGVKGCLQQRGAFL